LLLEGNQPPVQFLGFKAFRFVSITEAATAASSGVISRG
jgi:hypothetical protein